MSDKSVKADSSFAVLIQMMGNIPPDQLETILSKCYWRNCASNEIVIEEGEDVDVIFFVETGSTRHFTSDKAGNEYTTHFAFPHEFSTDYGAFITRSKSTYSVETLQETRLVAVPREAYDWMARNVKDGEKLIRMVTESFFLYFAARLRENYVMSPLERYQAMEQKFPGIYEQVPQYMIASYIGVSKVHLSRLKNESLRQKAGPID